LHKRIFNSFAGLVIVCIVGLAVIFSILFMNAAQNQEKAGIRDKARLVAGLLNSGTFEYSQGLGPGSTRMTIIMENGLALFDSHPGADLNINRSDRAEFVAAITYGSGEAIRASVTFGADTFYYAIRLDNGNILRLSRTLSSLGGVFFNILPILIGISIIILGVSYFITYRLTQRIVKPIAAVDYENPGTSLRGTQYEELWPYIKKIENQRHEITQQLSALQNRAETIDTIIANMGEGLVILDEKGLVMAANKSARGIFGVKKDVVQKNISHIYRDPEFIKSVKQCLEGTHMEINFTRRNRIYNAFLNPVLTNGKGSGAIIFFLDTTEQYKAETQRREFTANVSHELKTPLTTISALAEMMATGMAKAEDMTDFAAKISSHTQRLINIIDDIIRLSEFDENKSEKQFASFDILQLAKTVVLSLQDKATEKSVAIEIKGQPLQVNANSRLIDELMYNLVENGIKYNKTEGNVTLSICEEDGWCKISVADTGIGIEEKYKSRVFQRFYRVDSSRSKKTGGTGLGLSIVKHITEHHGGRVALDSTEGVGTTITCYIPINLVSTIPPC